MKTNKGRKVSMKKALANLHLSIIDRNKKNFTRKPNCLRDYQGNE